MRRVFVVAHIPPAMWDTMTWLRQWEFEDTAMQEDIWQECTRPSDAQESADLSPRP